MKRFLTLLLVLHLLLTGCYAELKNPPNQETVAFAGESDTTTGPESSTEITLPQEQLGVPLLDQAEVIGENGNLLYIPNPHVESMACPEIRLYGNGLLLYEHTTDGLLHLKRISLEDGCLLAEASYPMSPSAQVQVGSGFIGICDSGSGKVLILNDSLEMETTYSVPGEGENWCLNQALETLYIFFPEEGLLSRDLATGQTQWLLDNAAMVQPIGIETGYALLSYTDRTDQKTYNRCLNLYAASLETIPVDGFISSGIRSGEHWLLRQNIASREYILISQNTASTFVWPEGLVELLSGRRHILITDGTYRNLYLYDLNGKFLSQCALLQNDYASVGTDLVWSGYWQGYFFRDTYDNAAHLMFWDTDIPQEGEDLSIVPMGTVLPPEPVMEKELYQRAKDLSQRFGLDIRIAEQCSLEYSHYEGGVLADPYFVQEALDILEQAFSGYPEGFFRQLHYGNLQQIRIELVANLRGKENMDTHPTSIGGFAQSTSDNHLIVFDGFSICAETVYHELSHIIDKRLEWDALMRSEALFSEETWLSLQPEGFRYAESYIDIPDALQVFENSGYFVSSYAMTFPTEDRATLMSLAMSDDTVLSCNPGMIEKMRYYAACIRDCFDTEGWSETTIWEKGLK